MFFDAFIQTISIPNILFMNLGVLIGIIFGALPGLSGGVAIVLFLPFSFYLSPIVSLSWLLGMYCGGTYGGSITAILIKTPGTAASAATTLDGYALTEQGKPGKALTMALIASTVGGLLSAIILLFTAPLISDFALKFGPAEYFSLSIFGISIIASVSGKNIFKGILMACLGVYVSMIGIDKMDAVPRLTFDNLYLSAGISLIPVLIGLFALPEIIKKFSNIDFIPAGTAEEKLSGSDKLSKEEIVSTIPIMLKSGIIGTIIGAIPGTGAAIASFLAYNEAKRKSKTPELFGKGSLEGIAASEAGNNGVTGATLIPLLTLGVPGDVVTAILVGAFLMHGITPGPSMFKYNKDVVYGIMLSMILINLFMFFQGKYLIRLFAKVNMIPLKILFPTMFLLCIVGTFVANNSVFDIYLIFVFGIIAFFCDKLELPITPMLLGIVLGPLAENNFRRALILSEGNYSVFLTKPISLFFIILIIVTIISFVKKQKGNHS